MNWSWGFELDNHVVYYAGDEKLKKNDVAFIIKKNFSRCILKYNGSSDWIISIRLQGRPVNTIIQIYAPTTKVKDEDIEAFYQLPRSEIDQICNQDALIITGDWNVKYGNKEVLVVGKHRLCDRNDAGDLMIEFGNISDFTGNNFFYQHKGQIYLQTSPDGIHKNQIDYIFGKRGRKKNSDRS